MVTGMFETENYFLWILVIVPLFFLPTSIDVFNFPKQWILVSLSLGALIHNQLFRISKVTPNPASSKLLFWALASLSLLVMASGLLTETTIIRALFGYPGRANGVLTFFAIFAIIWVGSTMAVTPAFQRKLHIRVVFLFAVVGIYSLIQFLNLDPVEWNNSYNRIIGTFGNPNFIGAFMGIFVSTMFIALIAYRTERMKLLIASFGILLGVVVIKLSDALQGAIIPIFGISALSLIYLKYFPKNMYT
jgi:hypothetical protein